MANVSEERREGDDFAAGMLSWAGAYTILFIGASHVLMVGEHFLVAPYLGVLFLANFAGSIVVAAGLFLGRHTWAWLLGDLIAGGALIGFLASRSIGLPGVTEFVGLWLSIAGVLSLALEGLFLALSLLAITPQGRALVNAEQRRIERERTPPAVQEMPANFEEIEEEMAGIRERMAPHLYDLRKHTEPQLVKEQVERNLRERLRDIIHSLGLEPRRVGPLVPLLVLALVAIFVTRRVNGRNGRR